jgi:CoA-binding domain
MSLSALTCPASTPIPQPVARAIPGIGCAAATPKKKAGALRRDPATRVDRPLTQPTPSLLQTLLQSALPTASADGDRLKLAEEVVYDFVVILLSVFAAHLIAGVAHSPKDSSTALLQSVSADLVRDDFGLALIYGSLITLLSHTEGLFRCAGELTLSDELTILARSVAWATFLVAAANSFFGDRTLGVEMLSASAVLATAGMHTRRAWQRRAQEGSVGKRQPIRNVLIIGTGRPAHQIAEYIANNPRFGRSVRGFLNEKGRGCSQVLGSIKDLPLVARAEFIDEVIVTIPRDKEVGRIAILEALRNHLDVRIVPDLLGFTPRRTAVECLGAVPTIPLNEEPIPQFGLLLKRAVDIVASGALAGNCAVDGSYSCRY